MIQYNGLTEVFWFTGTLVEEDHSGMEKFIGHLFGYSKVERINEAQYLYFQNEFKSRTSERPLDGIKYVDPSMLPPCYDALVQQI